MNSACETAFKLLTLGFSVIPSGGGDKHKAPLVNWRDYQTTAPDESQLQAWESQLNPHLWGIITNDRIAVIDADIPDAIALITHDTKTLTENGELPDYTATLGMPVEDAIKLWKSAGAPVIYLGPGENCLDLGKVLSNSGIADQHLKAVKAWLQKHKGGVLC